MMQGNEQKERENENIAHNWLNRYEMLEEDENEKTDTIKLEEGTNYKNDIDEDNDKEELDNYNIEAINMQ